MNGIRAHTPARQAALTGLAVVGFVALVGLGLVLAVYSARYVPGIASRLGLAPAPASLLDVVPTASTTLPFDEDASTAIETSAPEIVAPPVTKPKPIAAGPGHESNTSYVTNGPVALYGLPDLTVVIEGVGYGVATDFGGFIASPVIPHSAMGAVKFRIVNIGTNATGPWTFSASLPTNPVTIRAFPMPVPLNPGDSVEFVLDFTQLSSGNQMVSVSADPGHQVFESNENNNSAAVPLVILGS
ncbi:MAG: CARDB domain-containing protein [bacterium]|nr:CARDB domain-containing protein [bacterium]